MPVIPALEMEAGRSGVEGRLNYKVSLYLTIASRKISGDTLVQFDA